MNPSWSRAASDIMSGFHGGSNTSSMSAWRTSAMRLELAAHVLDQDRPHAAGRRGERHLDADVALAVLLVGADRAVVDQAELDDVDRDLGVEDGAQQRPHAILERTLGRRRRGLAAAAASSRSRPSASALAASTRSI